MSVPEQMKALAIRKYGGPSELAVETMATPALVKTDQVLVKVDFAGVNPVDYKIRQGDLASLMSVKFPLVLGIDFSGTLVAKHPSSECPIELGSKVYGKLFRPATVTNGTYAEFLRVNWKTDMLSKSPDLPGEELAGVGVCALTAVVALADYLKVSLPPASELPAPKRDFKILIIGASGGVGSFATQIAHMLGIHVIGVCSGRNVEFVTSLGANQVIDYKQGPLPAALEKLGHMAGSLDGICDFVGGDEYFKNLSIFLKPKGHFVTATGPTSGKVTFGVLATFGGLVVRRNLAALFGRGPCYAFISSLPTQHWGYLTELISRKLIRTTVYKTFPLAEGVKAHEEIQTGRSVGKIVIQMS